MSAIVLFDGVCNFCNASVNFIIDRDPSGYFTFGTLQSEEAKEILHTFRRSTDRLDTIILVEDGKIYTRSTAALRVARKLSGLWPLFYGFIILPRFLRDPVYNFIASIRYKIFGRRDVCRVPTSEEWARFL